MVLQYLNTEILPNAECQRVFDGLYFEDPNDRAQVNNVLRGKTFCTSNRWGEGTCFGDSGGPLVSNGVLVGIISCGCGCGLGYPDIHTDVYQYHPWIMNEMSKTIFESSYPRYY